jgi:hypothetical protein
MTVPFPFRSWGAHQFVRFNGPHGLHGEYVVVLDLLQHHAVLQVLVPVHVPAAAVQPEQCQRMLSSVSDPDPYWNRIQSGQWIRIRIRNPERAKY